MLDAEIRISVDVDMPTPPGLRYVCDSGPAIRRRRAGKGFVYLDAKGRRVANVDTLKRVRALVIPPAWTDVWICPSAHGHIQATGRDAKGRKQYRYHADYREAREEHDWPHAFATLDRIETNVPEALDVAAARAAGLRTIWMNRRAHAWPRTAAQSRECVHRADTPARHRSTSARQLLRGRRWILRFRARSSANLPSSCKAPWRQSVITR